MSLIIRVMQNKTIHRYHFTSIRMVIIKKKSVNISEDMEKLEPLCTAGRKAK